MKMNEMNLRPAPLAGIPENFFELQKARLMNIPVAENARRAKQRVLFFITLSAACLCLAIGLSVPAIVGNTPDTLDSYYSSLSDSSLQQTIDMADADPFFEAEQI